MTDRGPGWRRAAAALAIGCGALGAGCGPRPAPAAVAAPLGNHRGAIPDPEAATPRPVLDATPKPAPYRLSQGQHVAGVTPPWVAAIARAASIDLAALTRALGVDGPAPASAHDLMVGPLRRSTRDWTYVVGAFRLQQLMLVWIDDDTGPWPVVLVSSDPEADTAASTWRLVLLDPSLRPVAAVDLIAPLPGLGGLWDTLATDVDIVGDRVGGGDLGVWIDYGHAGGGEPCDVVYRFRVRVVGRPSRLVLRHRAVERGPCPAAGWP
jgi:hypothetical protein